MSDPRNQNLSAEEAPQSDRTEKFAYSYTALTEAERKEIASIRKAYLPPDDSPKSKLEQIRALDKKVRSAALLVSLLLGILGSLVFGTGFALVTEWNHLIPGAIVASIGGLSMILAYPAHRLVTAKQKRKYAAEILRLSEETLGKQNKDNR